MSKNSKSHQSTASGPTSLHDAILKKNYPTEMSLDLVRRLISNGADVEEKDKRGRTALFCAVERQKLEVIEYLLSIGANVNCITNRQSTPLLTALRNRDIDAICSLLEHGATVDVKHSENKSCLHMAMNIFKNPDVRYKAITMLVAKGANMNDIIDPSEKSSVLHVALQKKDVKLANFLIAEGATIDVKNIFSHSPLFIAVTQNLLPVVSKLVERGADVNDFDGKGTIQAYNTTVLTRAVSHKNEEMVNLLVQHGADCKNKGVVMKAAEKGNVNIMKIVVSGGADINTYCYGCSPVTAAADCMQQAMVEYLLENGADINIGQHQYQLALHCAFERYLQKYREHDKPTVEILHFLMKHIALLLSRNLHVNELNMSYLRDPENASPTAKIESYCHELDDMKSTKVCADSSMTYFEFLVKRGNALVNCLRIKNIRETLASRDNYITLFMGYWIDVERNYKRGMERLGMIDQLRVSLHELFHCVFPYDITCKIIDLFSDDDLMRSCK